MVNIHDLDDIDIVDTLEGITERPQPVYLYYYEADSDYLLVSDKEIDEDDIEKIARELIAELDKEPDFYDDET